MAGRRTVFAVAAVAVTVALLWPRVTVELPNPALPWDKITHLAVFAALGVVGVWARIPLRWLVTILVAQAVGTEVLQGLLLPERTGDPVDLAVDLLGIAIGVGVAAGVGLAVGARRTRSAS